MTRVSKGSVFIRGAWLLSAFLIIIAVYALLTSARQVPTDMLDTFESRHGWTYETLDENGADKFTPIFKADGYGMEALQDDCKAVSISREMTEDFGLSQLVFYAGEVGIEVSLGKEVLYSDFQTSSRDAHGFLAVDEKDFAPHMNDFRKIVFPLPEDHVGKTLTVYTYFPKDLYGIRTPVYPLVETEWASNNSVVESVRPVATATSFALLAAIMLVMFLIDGADDQRDASFALLAWYFLTLFLYRSYSSLPGIYSKLSEFWVLGMAEYLYPTFLYMALATRLSGWRKWGLLSASVVQFLFTLCVMVKNYMSQGMVYSADAGNSAALLLFVTLAFVAAELIKRREAPGFKQYVIAAIWLATAAIYSVYDAKINDYPLGLYFKNMYDSALEYGNFLPFVRYISSITAYTCAIALVWMFVNRLLERQRAHMAIAERSRLTLMHYQSLLDFEEKDRQLRHEMKHHLSAISALLDSGDFVRAREYINGVADQANDVPMVALCRNLLVSAIVGRYLKIAQDCGIEATAHILVPAQVNISDEDMCVYLTNLLENAIEACENCGHSDGLYIRLTMEKQGNFIYIGCRNSLGRKVEMNEDELPNTTKQNPGEHGYGMIAMRRIAEKYHSVLLIKQTPGEFSVMTNLLDQ